MTASARKTVSLLLGLTVSVVLLTWAWRDIAWGQIWLILTQIHGIWLGLAWILFTLAFYLRANRWGVLLQPHGDPGALRIRQAAVFIGFGSNCIFPLNAGELVRAKVLQKSAKIPLGIALGSILSARLLDALTAFFLLVLSVGVQQYGNDLPSHELPIVGLGLVLVGLIIAFYGAARFPTRLVQGIEAILLGLHLDRWRSPITKGVSAILKGLQIFRSPRLLLIAGVQSFVIWGLGGLTFWFGLKAFDIVEPGFAGAYFILSIQAMAAIIPSSPGHLGAFEAAMRFALGVYDVPVDEAIAYSLMMRILMYGTLIILGFVYAVILGVISKA